MRSLVRVLVVLVAFALTASAWPATALAKSALGGSAEIFDVGAQETGLVSAHAHWENWVCGYDGSPGVGVFTDPDGRMPWLALGGAAVGAALYAYETPESQRTAGGWARSIGLGAATGLMLPVVGSGVAASGRLAAWYGTRGAIGGGTLLADSAAATNMLVALTGEGVMVGGILPRGFSSQGQFSRFSRLLNSGLKGAGFDDVTPILQGSAVTGKNSQTGRAFDDGRTSDFDIALAGESIFDRAKSLGIGLRSQGTRTGPLSSEEVEKLGLGGLQKQLTDEAGREVNFMIFRSASDAAARAPSEVLPP